MKSCVIFLHGVYRADRLNFYKKLCKGKYLVAANGGSRFFQKSGLNPHLIIGDLDSGKKHRLVCGPKTRVLRFPSAKDKTDGALALEHCLKSGFTSIDIAMPSIGEPDHLLGVLTSLFVGKQSHGKSRGSVRIINHKFECFPVTDSSRTITGKVGEVVSVVPVSARLSLSSTGTEFSARNLNLKLGDSTGLRNRLTSKRARLTVRGKALLFHFFSRK